MGCPWCIKVEVRNGDVEREREREKDQAGGGMKRIGHRNSATVVFLI